MQMLPLILALLCAIVAVLAPAEVSSRNVDMTFLNDDPSATYKVYRVMPNTTFHLAVLLDLWKISWKYQFDFWKDPRHIRSPVDIMVPPATDTKFRRFLQAENMSYMVTINDVQRLIEKTEGSFDRKWQNSIRFDQVRRRKPFFNFNRYHSYDEIRRYMHNIASYYPNIAKVHTLGYSHENRPIEMLEIGYPIDRANKKAIFIDAGMHAREWASHSTAVYFIYKLVSSLDTRPELRKYINNLTWYIVPAVNPDGYEYTRNSTRPEVRMWRKNRSPSECFMNTRFCCRGVDLNRNFNFFWGEYGSSKFPCHETYAGKSQFSEPETRAISKFIYENRHKIKAYITMHTYSQLWIHSYSHMVRTYPPDLKELRRVAYGGAEALRRVYGTNFKVGSGADLLYPSAGGSDDWSKYHAKIKYVYLLELRPDEDVNDGFIVSTRELLPIGQETWEGVRFVADTVLNQDNKKQ